VTTFEATPWQERLAEQNAAFKAKKAKEKADRAKRKRERNWGLTQRHAIKLRRIEAERQ
jgi:hypothetical protein